MASISTLTFLGSPPACTVERAGRWSPKCSAYTSFMAANSPMSARKTVVLTTVESDAPEASSTAARLRSTWCVCSRISPVSSSPVDGTSGICPEAKRSPPARIAWE